MSRTTKCLALVEHSQPSQLDTTVPWCVRPTSTSHLEAMVDVGMTLCQPWIVYNQVFRPNNTTAVLTVGRRDETVCVWVPSLSISCTKDVIPNRLVPTFAHLHIPTFLGNKHGTVPYNRSLYCSCGPFGRQACKDYLHVSVAVVPFVSDMYGKNNNRQYRNVMMQLPKRLSD